MRLMTDLLRRGRCADKALQVLASEEVVLQAAFAAASLGLETPTLGVKWVLRGRRVFQDQISITFDAARPDEPTVLMSTMRRTRRGMRAPG